MRGAVEDIKARLSIEEVVGGYVKLERAGKNLKARCPFHHEKTASFFVSPARGGFYCFGCSAKGDIFNFVEQMEGVDFRGALTTLAARAGVKLEQFRTPQHDAHERIYAALEAATAFFETGLAARESARRYLAERGLTPETMTRWRIGFAPDAWRDLRAHLRAHGFSDRELLAAGLIKQSDKADPFDVFRNRITFPLWDIAGRIVGFSGRIWGEASESVPKYLNTPETPVWSKSRMLYGIHAAKQKIRERGFALLVEGQVDLVMAHQAEFTNAVATSGTALTEEHLALLRRFSENLMLAYDADAAGEKAALRAIPLALQKGFAIKIAGLPGKDPAEILAKNPSDFTRALKESMPIVRFALTRVLARTQTPRERAVALRTEVFPLVRDTASALERAEWVKEIARSLGVREESVWEELKHVSSTATNFVSSSDTSHSSHFAGTILRTLASIIFWQEGLPEAERRVDVEKIKKEAGAALLVYAPEREALIFEAEARFGANASLEKEVQFLLWRHEDESLKQTLADALDALTRIEAKGAEKGERARLLSEVQRISGRVQELTRLLAE